jgi:hypothetical protein
MRPGGGRRGPQPLVCGDCREVMDADTEGARAMWRGKRILGFWLPFIGFRDDEAPSPIARAMNLRSARSPAFVIEWFDTGFKLFL